MRPPTAFVPDPDRAHDLLARELAHAAYQRSLGERISEAFDHLVDRAQNAAGSLSDLGWPVLLALVVVVVGLLAWLLARLQRNPATEEGPTPVFDDVRRPAAEHRRLARAALADEDWDTAVVEGVRGLAAGLVERGLVPDVPATTAREVTGQAAARFPALAVRLDAAALTFDETRYGDHHATRDRAVAVLAVDDDLAASTPTGGSSGPVLAVPR
jgi:hypothetical protein